MYCTYGILSYSPCAPSLLVGQEVRRSLGHPVEPQGLLLACHNIITQQINTYVLRYMRRHHLYVVTHETTSSLCCDTRRRHHWTVIHVTTSTLYDDTWYDITTVRWYMRRHHLCTMTHDMTSPMYSYTWYDITTLRWHMIWHHHCTVAHDITSPLYGDTRYDITTVLWYMTPDYQNLLYLAAWLSRHSTAPISSWSTLGGLGCRDDHRMSHNIPFIYHISLIEMKKK